MPSNEVRQVRDYLGGIEYFERELEAVYYDGGRVFYTETSSERQYVLGDYQGNNRVLFKDDGNGTADIIEDYAYYPFGAIHEQQSDYSSKYLFGGKELQTELDLGWSDYGVRCLDNWSGKWMGVDIMAEYNAGSSPYTFASANPIRFSDPSGMISEDENGMMQVSTDLWGGGRNQNFMNQSASNAASNAQTTRNRQAGYIDTGTGSGVGSAGDFGWLAGGQLQKDLTTYSVEFNRHAGEEIGREMVGNGVNITYEGRSITREMRPDPNMIAGIGSAATLQGSAMALTGEILYSTRMGTFLNSQGQFRTIRNHFTRTPGIVEEMALAKTSAKAAKYLGNGFAGVAYLSTAYGYANDWNRAGGYPGHSKTFRMGADVSVNTIGVFGGVFGAAANVGWETGRLITNSEGYKYNVWGPGGRDGLISTDE